MSLDPMFMAFMEESGEVDTKEGRINRVALSLKKCRIQNIDTSTFERVCRECGIDPTSFTQKDIQRIEMKLK